ncbi:enoyl-CoA hydratase/isomerase family protein, partial [Streptomyces triticagri]
MNHERDTLSATVHGPVLRVRMHGGGSGNVVDEALLDDLAVVLTALRDRPALRVLVLDGDGTDFCLGTDRQDLERRISGDPGGADIRRLGDKAKQVCEALEAADALTIARIQGRAVGAGLALAAFCDLRAGTADAAFRLPELAVGLPTAWGGAIARLITEIGASRIRELALTCDVLDARTAHALGLLHRVADTPEGLDVVVDTWARGAAR